MSNGGAPPPDPPSPPPPAMRIYQACELFSKAPGVGVVIASASGVVVVLEMQLGVTSKTMQVDWAIHYK